MLDIGKFGQCEQFYPLEASKIQLSLALARHLRIQCSGRHRNNSIAILVLSDKWQHENNYGL